MGKCEAVEKSLSTTVESGEAKMEKRVDLKTGNQVSLLGFGCMRFPTKSQNATDIDYEKVSTMVDYALSHGVNYYDTAAPYHGGESERVIGSILSRYPRSSYFLADKMPIWMVNSQTEMETFFAEQLKKCQTEYFDYYLIHNITESKWQKIETLKCFEFLAQKKKEGKIRSLGFSFHDGPAVLKKVATAHPWDFAQIQLNYLDWQLQEAGKQYDILVENHLPVIVMEPLRGGSLVSLCKESIEILQKARPDLSIGSWALRFAASLPEVLTVLSGMTYLEHLDDNIKTMTAFEPLSIDDKETIETALTAYRKAAPVPCTACQYCMPCPVGVDIPKNFGIYNQYLTNGKVAALLLLQYKALSEGARAADCIACGKCRKNCPQHIDIPQLMQEITTAVEQAKPQAPVWL